METSIDKLLTVQEAAQQIPGGAVSEAYIRLLIKDKRLVAQKVGRQWFVDPQSLAEFVPDARGRKRKAEVSL